MHASTWRLAAQDLLQNSGASNPRRLKSAGQRAGLSQLTHLTVMIAPQAAREAPPSKAAGSWFNKSRRFRPVGEYLQSFSAHFESVGIGRFSASATRSRC